MTNQPTSPLAELLAAIAKLEATPAHHFEPEYISPEEYAQRAADPDDPPVQCWHTEAGTPCDWDVCNQPERLAAGDHGTDPKEQH